MLYDAIYSKITLFRIGKSTETDKKQTDGFQGLRTGEMRSNCLVSTEFPLEVMKMFVTR